MLSDGSRRSFPSRERGLKLLVPGSHTEMYIVVPLAGTWIETIKQNMSSSRAEVVPLAGTWIETIENNGTIYAVKVVPLAGTWIETSLSPRKHHVFTSFPSRERGLKLLCTFSIHRNKCRSPRGNVD